MHILRFQGKVTRGGRGGAKVQEGKGNLMKRTTNKIGTTAMKDKRPTAETRVIRVVPMMRKEEVAAPHKLPKAAIPTLSLESKKVQTLQKLRKPTINSLWNTILTKEAPRGTRGAGHGNARAYMCAHTCDRTPARNP